MKLTGLPTIYDIDPLSTSTTQNMKLGAIGYDAIGRRYRYAKAGAVALVAGNLLQSPARDAQFGGAGGTDLAVLAAAAGQNQITFTNGTTTIAAGDFVDGTVSVTVTPGIGQSFTIRSHTTGGSGASITLTLNENLNVALTTSSKIVISPNPYNGVVVSPTTRTGKTVGVALAAIPIAGFGWIGCEGRFAVLSDATVAAIGESLSASTSTAGCVTKQVTLLETIGSAAVGGVSARCEPADLQLP